MPNVSDKIALRLVDHLIDLLRIAAGSSKKVLTLLNQLEKDLGVRLSNSELSSAQRGRLLQVLSDARAYVDSAYSRIEEQQHITLAQLMEVEGKVLRKIVKDIVGVDILSATVPPEQLVRLAEGLLVRGAPSSAWWSKQSREVLFKFEQQLRIGLASNETNAQLVARIRGTATQPGIMDVTRSQATMLVRTSVQTAANNARLEMFRANSDVIRGVQQISTLDLRTTDICIAYDHQAWTLKGVPIPPTKLPFKAGPPRHFGCRSTLIPLLKNARQMGLDLNLPVGTRESMDGQVAANLSFEDWFKSRTREQQDEILGPGKAQLWRDGRITLTDLLDQRGNPLTLEQLKEKYGLH